MTPNNDFINCYLKYCGISEVPSRFHLFACLSLLAASVADRIWFRRDESGGRIYPNLYVFLIGPSGSGKEKAINTAARFAEGLPDMGLLVSTGITKQFLIDHLSRPPQADVPTNLMWLVTEELSMSIPSRELGQDLIKFMTGHYIKSGLTSTEGTRMHGPKLLRDPVANWLAGTTDEWLLEGIGKNAMISGALARVLSVRGRRDGTIRYANMTYPANRDVLQAALQVRVEMYTKLHAQFVKTPEADANYAKWYVSHEVRPSPNDSLMEPAFNRSDEMVHRLAMILKLSHMENIPGFFCDIPVEWCYFDEAIQIWTAMLEDVPDTLKKAIASKDSADIDVVLDLIKRHKSIDHSTLLKRASNHGIHAGRLKGIIYELTTDRQDVKMDVEAVGGGKTKRVYRWTGSA